MATPGEILAILGQRLQSQRLKLALTQSDLAARAGLSVGAVRHLERSGMASMETLVRVVSALGMIEELQPLFQPKVQSIAEMTREHDRPRRRAPRVRKQDN